MIGRKLNTLPTPAKTPSMSRLCTTGFNPYAVSPLSQTAVNASIPTASQSLNAAPTTWNVSQKIKNMISRNIGIARYLFVSTPSIFTLRMCSLLS